MGALSLMNGAQLQQLALCVVCNLSSCYASSRVPLAIAHVNQINQL